MCGRFTLYDKEGIKKKFSVDITPSYNVAPSQNVLVIDSQPHIKRWSFTPDWAKEDFNLIKSLTRIGILYAAIPPDIPINTFLSLKTLMF